jgi:lysine 2,3-aminomutase
MTKPLRSPRDLAAANLITPERVAALDAVTARYAVAIPPARAALIVPADPADPIGRQFLPSEAELRTLAEERADPIGDAARSPVPGIVHRHRDRALFKIVSACPVYCRFCFRRETIGPASETSLSPEALEAALTYIAAHREIWEVILTGGDPLILAPRRIAEVSRRLAAIAHVKVVRWHTRVPVVDPDRITEDTVAALKAAGAATWLAIHANHPREFSTAARRAVARLADAGVPLVSQTVLLRGVNDDPDTLDALMRSFVENRIKPYYVHHPDLAPGTSHFRVSIGEGLALMHALRRRLSGLAMPTYVLDLPGGYAKVPLESHNVQRVGQDRWRITDPEGRVHHYPPADQVSR